jgi:nicotinamidase-related amidase
MAQKIEPREDLAEILNPRHTALLVLDMQNDFCSPGGKVFDAVGAEAAPARAIIPSIARLVETARRIGLFAVYLQTTHLASGVDESAAYIYALKKRGHRRASESNVVEGSWGHEIVNELKPAPQEAVVKKFSFDAFHNSILDQVLRNYGIVSLVLTGAASYGVVLTTARAAFCRGYYVAVVKDCIAGYSESLHRASLELLKEDLLSADEVSAIWRRS